ncbi:MAG: hypothetical protein AAF512_09345, partial [Pseudomonadota bacterium]
ATVRQWDIACGAQCCAYADPRTEGLAHFYSKIGHKTVGFIPLHSILPTLQITTFQNEIENALATESVSVHSRTAI